MFLLYYPKPVAFPLFLFSLLLSFFFSSLQFHKFFETYIWTTSPTLMPNILFFLVLLFPIYFHLWLHFNPPIQLIAHIIEHNMCPIHLKTFLHLHECQCISIVHNLLFLVYHRYDNWVSNVNWHFTLNFNVLGCKQDKVEGWLLLVNKNYM